MQKSKLTKWLCLVFTFFVIFLLGCSQDLPGKQDILRYGVELGKVYKDGGLLTLDLRTWDGDNAYPPSKDLDVLFLGNITALHQVVDGLYDKNTLGAKAQYFERQLGDLCDRVNSITVPAAAREAHTAWVNYYCDNYHAFSIYTQYVDAVGQGDGFAAGRLYEQYLSKWNNSSGFYSAMDDISSLMAKYGIHCADIGMCGYHIDW